MDYPEKGFWDFLDMWAGWYDREWVVATVKAWAISREEQELSRQADSLEDKRTGGL